MDILEQTETCQQNEDNLLDLIDEAIRQSRELHSISPKVAHIISVFDYFIKIKRDRLRDVIETHGRLSFLFSFDKSSAATSTGKLNPGVEIVEKSEGCSVEGEKPNASCIIPVRIHLELDDSEKQQLRDWMTGRIGTVKDANNDSNYEMRASTHPQQNPKDSNNGYFVICCYLNMETKYSLQLDGSLKLETTKDPDYIEPLIEELKSAVPIYLSCCSDEIEDVMTNILDPERNFRRILALLRAGKNVMYNISFNGAPVRTDIVSPDLMKKYEVVSRSFEKIRIRDLAEIYQQIYAKFNNSKHYLSATFYNEKEPVLTGKVDEFGIYEWQYLAPFNITLIFRNNEHVPLPLISSKLTLDESNELTSEKSNDPTPDKSDELTFEKSNDPTPDKSNELTLDKSNVPTPDKSDELTPDKSDELALEKFNELTLDEPNELTLDNPSKLTLDESNELTLDNPSQLTLDEPNELILYKPNKLTLNKSDELTFNKSNERTLDKSGELILDKSDELTFNKSNEHDNPMNCQY
ncbi:Hypothetical protein HVR_LOCUS367 [uncultured virus]|nr:Hypothetical protein HVR_LOCUS367 [uncultured virus]